MSNKTWRIYKAIVFGRINENIQWQEAAQENKWSNNKTVHETEE